MTTNSSDNKLKMFNLFNNFICIYKNQTKNNIDIKNIKAIIINE